MTVSSTDRTAGPFIGNGSQTVFPFSVYVFDRTDLVLVRVSSGGTRTTLVLDTDYTVSLNADQDNNPGGSVTLTTALASGTTLEVSTDVPETQGTRIPNASGYYPRIVERALDRLTVLVQQLRQVLSQTVRVDDIAGLTTLPSAQERANTVLSWDEAGNPTVFALRDALALASTIAYGDWVTDVFDGDGTTTAFTLSANPGSVNNIDLRVDGVPLAPGLDFTLAGSIVTLVEPPPEDTDNVVVRYGQAVPTGITLPESINYTLPSFGAVQRTVRSRLSDAISIKDFGAVGDGDSHPLSGYFATLAAAQAVYPHAVALTDEIDWAAAQLAINAVGAAGGGEVIVPRAPDGYVFNRELLIDYPEMRLVGQSASGEHLATTGATRIIATHTAGAVIRIQRPGCEVAYLVLDSDATREAAAVTAVNCGVRVEAPDTASLGCRRTHLHHLRVTNGPGHAYVLAGEMTTVRLDLLIADQCGGHNIVISDGLFTGRTNRDRPGMVSVVDCRTVRMGGHGILVGSQTDDDDRPYRIRIENLEMSLCCRDAAVKVKDYNGVVFGENVRISGSATGGETDLGVPGHGGLHLSGRDIVVDGHRFVDCDVYCAYVADRAGYETRGVQIDVGYINNDNEASGYYDPAIFVESGCRDVGASYFGASSDVTSLISVSSEFFEYDYEGVHRYDGQQVAGCFKSSFTATLADDNAGFWGFEGVTQGVAVIAGNTSGAGTALIAFRVGDGSAYCAVLSSSGVTVDATTGTLADAGGTDTRLTISADTANARLYISNRTGASRNYVLTVLSATARASGTFVEV